MTESATAIVAIVALCAAMASSPCTRHSHGWRIGRRHSVTDTIHCTGGSFAITVDARVVGCTR